VAPLTDLMDAKDKTKDEAKDEAKK